MLALTQAFAMLAIASAQDFDFDFGEFESSFDDLENSLGDLEDWDYDYDLSGS